MSDIVEAMRYCASTRDGSNCAECQYSMRTGGECVEGLLAEAADEIEKLRSELEAERKKHKWYTVEEKLPENEESVIAVAKNGSYYPQARLSNGTWEWAYEAGADYWADIYVPVTHWMPSPEPPKEE